MGIYHKNVINYGVTMFCGYTVFLFIIFQFYIHAFFLDFSIIYIKFHQLYFCESDFFQNILYNFNEERS